MGNQTPDENTAENAGEQSTPKQFDAITSQEDLDRIVQDRIARERKKFADYEEAKAAQKKLAELEEANKSELEKAVARAEAAEAKLVESEKRSIRSAVLAKHAIPEDFQDLVVGDTEEALSSSAERIAALIKGKQFEGLVDRKQGATPNQPADSGERETVRALFGE